MGMKVLLINGSYRKKNTYNVLLQTAEILKTRDIETEIVNLFDYDIKDCTGCDDPCILQNGCDIQDDMQMIMQKILDSNGVVFGSPIYTGNVTSKFKAFADRTNEWFHKPKIAGKPVLFVVTTAVTGIKDTIHFLDQFATGLGARKGGSITRTGANNNIPVHENELAGILSLLFTDKKNYKPKINELLIFIVQKVHAHYSSGNDKVFWEEKNWNDKYYYYDCRINFIKKAISRILFGVISGALKEK